MPQQQAANELLVASGHNAPSPEYHHAEDCYRIRDSDRAKWKPEAVLPADIKPCGHCGGSK